jgi:hypothetical protein
MGELVPCLPEEAFPAFVSNDSDASQHKLIIMAAMCVGAE